VGSLQPNLSSGLRSLSTAYNQCHSKDQPLPNEATADPWNTSSNKQSFSFHTAFLPPKVKMTSVCSKPSVATTGPVVVLCVCPSHTLQRAPLGLHFLYCHTTANDRTGPRNCLMTHTFIVNCPLCFNLAASCGFCTSKGLGWHLISCLLFGPFGSFHSGSYLRSDRWSMIMLAHLPCESPAKWGEMFTLHMLT